MAEPAPGGGGGLNHKLGPLPVWLWAVLAGAGLGGIWFLRSRNSAAAQPANAADATADDTNRTTIVPSIDAGLSESQWQQLMNAIRGLYGQNSAPPPPDDTPPPDHINNGIPPAVPGGSIHVTPPATSPTTGGSNTSAPSKTPVFITVPQGSGWSWSSIAAQYGHSWQDLWAYNLTPGIRPAATEAQLKSEGVNHSLFGGTKVAVPSNWKKV